MPKKGKESQQLTPEVNNHEDRLNNLEKRENAETTRLYDRLHALEKEYSASIFINTEDIKEMKLKVKSHESHIVELSNKNAVLQQKYNSQAGTVSGLSKNQIHLSHLHDQDEANFKELTDKLISWIRKQQNHCKSWQTK